MSPPSVRAAARDRKRLEQFERTLVRVRWFGVVLGLWQVSTYHPIDGSAVPPGAREAAFAAVAGLALVNVLVMLSLRSSPDTRSLRRLGLLVFVFDVLLLWGLTWTFSFERFGLTFVILYIAPLEGALRYQLAGAMAPVAAAVLIEPLRDWWRLWAFDHPFDVPVITFRVGIMAMLGLVGGVMARGMQREREQAERRALLLEDLAARESALRGELHAFHEVLLAGVSAPHLERALGSMADRIAAEFGYSSLTVLVAEDDGRLYPVAGYGIQPHVLSLSIAIGEGISGAVASSGSPEIVDDVSKDARYYEISSDTRSEVGVPIVGSERILGVLSAESDRLAAFGPEDVKRLERLAAQMALVIENARLLAQERATIERMRELDAMKSDFVAITSHELRTPLTAMRGFIKTLRRPDLEIGREELHEFLGILDRQSDRLARLVEELLMAARIDAGALQLRMESVRIPDILAEMLLELGPRAERVRLVVDQDLPVAVTDGQRLGQIARNLVENAIKFSPEDSTVRLTALSEDRRLTLEVADKGPGISPEEVPRIFDRFHQVGGSMRRRGEGFGLGLYITRRLVEALGGTIQVDSTPGRGTTFRVQLPLAVGEERLQDGAAGSVTA